MDVFAGAGGLGEGFAACPKRSAPAFRVALSIEKDYAAVRTLRLRAFYHAFSPEHVPEDYYRLLQGKTVPERMTAYLSGTIPLSQLLEGYTNTLTDEVGVVWHKELSDNPNLEQELDERIKAVISGRNDWVLVGGPPCQPFSTVGRSKQKSLAGYQLETDARHELYREYLRVIVRHWPAVFIMENVSGILSAKVNGHNIFPRILEDLGDPEHAFGNTTKPSQNRHTYNLFPLEETAVTKNDLFGVRADPKAYLIQCEKHGIPQMRHRVILLGIRSDIDIRPRTLNACLSDAPTVISVIDGLPRLRSGIARTPESRDQWRQIAEAVYVENVTACLTLQEMDDVLDTDHQWLATLKSATQQTWYDELENDGQHDITTKIRNVLANIKSPKAGRGSDCIPVKSCWSSKHHDPDLKAWIDDPRMNFICQHAAREHMPRDLHRYLFVAAFAAVRLASPRLRDFPKSLLPEHKNVGRAMSNGNFADRFRSQMENQPATTVLSHIAKDGHYFIHHDPSQVRSLSVREVARLQTFPDNYWFSGSRSEQYTQIGNAVPPLLSFQIAEIVADVISRWKQQSEDKAMHLQQSALHIKQKEAAGTPTL
ncbi:MAG: DNA (cytosine-5-)-methyltransferase [Lamprobacter sp.]|uniref:DNA cytosine methyltransferase n=1 Tax=Lamprobacter sp. TaxID=3100796 RepID=UPI002B25D3A8|nr:DNA (cytosine-5-)-methyltransferase [Lamprobacter sp.]MEA3640229.1 DNA (cytosine-5-)-methyltransferase [Lamprobacter sp.]